jgi:hypothetical protein
LPEASFLYERRVLRRAELQHMRPELALAVILLAVAIARIEERVSVLR